MSTDSPATTYKISTGRGGAGNIHSTSSKMAPKLIPQGSHTPNILQPVFSTGRGGAGNMRRNVDAKLTRKAQDVEDESDDEDNIAINSEDDYISPLQTGENAQAVLSGGALSNNIMSSGNESKIRTHKSRSKRNSSHERPKAIVLGRGGAGNIITPTSSRKSVKGKKKNNKTHESKGILSIFKKFFS